VTVSVALAGCTGSIGRQTVEVVAADPDRYRIDAVSVGSSVADAVQVVASTGARVLAVADEAARFAAARNAGRRIDSGGFRTQCPASMSALRHAWCR
jgi:1-deoxy-D-xylulose-5-phosphate reductoisomerase